MKRNFLTLTLMTAILVPSFVAIGASPSHAQSAQNVIRTIDSSKAGQFCKKADVGKKKRADNGARIKCKMVNGRARWVNA